MESSDGIRLSLPHGDRETVEDVAGGAEEFGWLTGFGDDADGLGDGGGAVVHAREATVVAGEDEDWTEREDFAEFAHEGDAVAQRHVDVAENEVGRGGGDAFQSFVGAGHRLRLIALLAEDEGEGSSDEGFIVYDEDAHGEAPCNPIEENGIVEWRGTYADVSWIYPRPCG